MRVRRLANQGPHSGQELVIERVIDQSGGYFGIVGTFEDGYFGTFDAERFEAIPDNIAPSLASPIQVSPTFTVGQEVIISERVTAPPTTKPTATPVQWHAITSASAVS